MSLCAIYAFDIQTYIRAAGLMADTREYCSLDLGERAEAGESTGDYWREAIKEVPCFVSDALAPLLGLRRVALNDCYLVGASDPLMHPCLQDAHLLIVNRHVRSFERITRGERPLFVVRTPAGALICGPCRRYESDVIVEPHPDVSLKSIVLSPREDVDVLGRVVGIVRRF